MTVTLIFAFATLVFAIAFLYDRVDQRARRRDREIVRKLHTYLASLPPARPW